LFWEIYNNEVNRNFCLVDSNGVKVPSYYLHQRFINQARLAVAQFQETNSRLPTDAEFSTLLGPVLGQSLPPPARLDLSNFPASVAGNSATLTGRLLQGVYGDDQAAVWVFWGTQDGGTVRTNWEAGRFLATNTNFNSAVFSTVLQALGAGTNYYFRFYATNAGGESWAPASGFFSTQALSPGDYGSRMKIAFSGYNGAGVLTYVPVLVTLSTNLPGFSYNRFAESNGGDLRFTDANGSQIIPHEIDEWNTNGTSFIWVQVPRLTGTNDLIWAYWGNPLATNLVSWSTNGSVWRPGYEAVWHLKESGFPYQDSAQGHALLAGNVPAAAPGIIGRCVSFDGSTQYLQADSLNLSNSFTFSAWIKMDPAATGIQTICANKPGGWNTDGFALYVNSYLTSDHKLLLETGDGTSGQVVSTAANLVTPGVWHQVAVVVNKNTSSARLFLDGIDQTQSGALQSDFNSGAPVELGRFTDSSYHFKGQMDEARFEQTADSADWILESWMTVAQNKNLASYSVVDLQPPLLSVSSLGPGVVANWVANGVGWFLSSATNLASPVLWRRVTNLPSLLMGRWQIQLQPDTNGSRFLRLESQ
jgi:hypothetical protein